MGGETVHAAGVDVDPAWVRPTEFLDSEHPAVVTFASDAIGDAGDDTAKAVRLFHAVRDGLRYDPYDTSRDPAEYRASSIVGASSSWCVPKSVLLAAAARASGIPARLGFADVVNHLTSEKLSEHMGTDVFAWHGYAELLLDDPEGAGCRWFKLSTAFNIELCERFGVKVLEFDGTDDALMHPYDEAGNRHMEYVRQRGSYDDLPLDEIFATFDELYGGPMESTAAEAGDDAFIGDDALS